MFDIYLTPASIAYLTEFILALAITLYLLNRLRSQRTRSLFLVIAFFAPMTVFIGLLVFNASLLPYPRILTVFVENATLGLALVALNSFAYHFPERYPRHKWEMRIVLAFSLSYFFWELGFMIFRYISLFTQGNVFIRPALVAYSIPIIILFAPVALLRQTLAADPRPVAWWRKLWKPQGKGALGARNFALVLGVPVVLGIVNALIFFGLPLAVIHAIISIGILLMLWLFANNYVNFIPGSVDVASRLSILTLTLFLALLGTLGWLIAPSYIATFQPALRDHQTVRFTPNSTGGYEVSEVDFHFEGVLGDKVRSETLNENGDQQVEFTFPFFGEAHTQLYANVSGIVSLGQPFRQLNFQADASRVPAIFPSVVALYPDPAEQDSGLYIRRESERLVITWNRLLSSQPGEPYTFQTILYSDGTFEFTYNGLPQHILFTPNGSPSDNLLLRGMVNGRGQPWYELPAGMEAPADLVALSRTGASPLLQNYLLAFRGYLHAFMLPVAWVVIGGSLLILLIIPLLLRSSVSKPLDALTAGVRRMRAGEMNISVPVQTEDEIGFLAGAFNTMSGVLDDMVRNLKTRVADRTKELDDANASLHAEMLQREAAQNQLLQWQRMLASFEERERLARELHDGIGQTLGYINMETEAARELIRQGDDESASPLLARLADATREAHSDLRRYIQNLKSEVPAPREDFFSVLEQYCQHLRAAYLFDVTLDFPQPPPDVLASAKTETHLTYIIREALTNARRYSGKRRATVAIGCDDETVWAVIEDRGVGMSNQYARTDRRTRERFGLRIMRERADDAGGTLAIESKAGKGTRVIARLPRDISSASLSGLRILLVDDHPLFSDGLRNMLTARGAQVVGMVKDGAKAQGAAQALNPDVILMDIRMPRMNGFEAMRQIKANLPEMKVVILTTSLSEADLFESLRAGASGFLQKGMSADALIAALGSLARGEAKFSAEVAQKILAEFPPMDETREPKGTSEPSIDSYVLTHRQMEILRLVANGLTYQEIGGQLYLTERTVKYHMGEILARLRLKGRREAEEYAKRRGIM